MNKNKLFFPIFRKHKKFIYFDSAATSLTPKIVIKTSNNYYEKYNSNPHNYDSNISFELNKKIEFTRESVQKFINSKSKSEIIFQSSTTYAINQIAYGVSDFLLEDDEIVITKLEHSSNVLPWYNLIKSKNIKIKFLELNNYIIDINKIKNVINSKTKIVSFASASNTLGYLNDVKKIISIIRSINSKIIIIVDAAQSIIHSKVDVQSWDCDFLVFSGHKMFAPGGISILYGKLNQLKLLKPFLLGGGMGKSIGLNFEFDFNTLPSKLEGGTPNSSSIFGLREAIQFINQKLGGVSNIQKYIFELQKYAKSQLMKFLGNRIIIYSNDMESNILLFNIKNVFSQDVATFLGNKYNILLRSGDHCSKLMKDLINTKSSLRMSFSVYNSRKEIDYLIKILIDEKEFISDIF